MNLRAPHWQEVADELARRCHHMLNSDPPTTTPKTAIQCRHKMEKVRKRYRLDWERSLQLHPNSPAHSTWVYFRKMDDMNNVARSSSSMGNQRSSSSKKAPLPVVTKTPSSSSRDLSETSSEEEEEQQQPYGGENNRMGNGTGRRRGWDPQPQPTSGYRFKIPKMGREKVGIPLNSVSGGRLFGYGNSDFNERGRERERERDRERKRRRDEYDEKDELRNGNCGPSVMGEIALAVRTFGEGYMKMEKLKMEMTRDFEKVKMDMELKRTKMILESHQQIVDAFVTGLAGSKNKNKRTRISPDSSS